MSTLGNLMAAGRSVDGSRKADYRVVDGPAVPAINLGRPKGYGNGLVERVREEMNRRMQARNKNPFAAPASAPAALSAGGDAGEDLLEGNRPGMDGVKPEPFESELAPGDVTSLDFTAAAGERIPAVAGGCKPIGGGAGQVRDAGEARGKRGVLGRLWAWLTRGGGMRDGKGAGMYQEELRLDAVKPLRSRPPEPGVESESGVPSGETIAAGSMGSELPTGTLAGRRVGARKLDILGRKSNPFIDGAEPGLTGRGGAGGKD